MSTNTLHGAAFGTMKGTKMKRLALSILSATAAIAPLALVPASPLEAQSVSRPTNDLVLSIGRGQLVTVGGTMADVFVANEAIADVQVKSTNQLYVFGKAGGETTVYASNSKGDVIWSANVRVGSNIDSVDQMLRMAMPDAKIAVSTMGTGTFLLTGTVASPEDAAEAQRLVGAFVGKEANVITRLKTATPMQVNLQVRFAEVSRSLAKEMGANLVTRDQSGGFVFGASRGRAGSSISGGVTTGTQVMIDPCAFYRLGCVSTPVPFDPITGKFVTAATTYAFPPNNSGSNTLGFAGKLLGLDLLSSLDIGERAGLVTTLSSPNLTALSGETAEFLAGGEYPIPISQGLGTTSIEFKKFGVSLAYTPTVLSNGRISLRVRPEVSELSSQGAITLNGFEVPALTVRRAETTVELGSGQSFMIAGLMSNNSNRSIDKLPGAGDLPILGALFRSTNFRKGETELVIIVTPYLVNPVDAKDIKLPTDGYITPNELQSTFGGMDNNGKSGGERPGPTAAPERQDATVPKVGILEESSSPLAKADGDKKNKRDRKGKKSADAAPGFSLN